MKKNIDEAEQILLKLADYIYAHTPLKPMSKCLYFISRLLLVVKTDPDFFKKNYNNNLNIDKILNIHEKISKDYSFIETDYDFNSLLIESKDYLIPIYNFLTTFIDITIDRDSLGLIFDTLIRGKFEAGEGLGTHLTPEEVVIPMCKFAIHFLSKNKTDKLIFADITAGTGRFMFHLIKELGLNNEFKNKDNEVYCFDQSKMLCDLAKVNFILDNNITAKCIQVNDSITDEYVKNLHNKCSLLLTNPPFGSNKYKNNEHLKHIFPNDILNFVGLKKNTDTTDPAWLFLIKNIELLTENGVLGIVLPSGLAHSKELLNILTFYKEKYNISLCVIGVFSLPSNTFAFGGTVAKTSVIFIQKTTKHKDLFYCIVNDIGFNKSGNKKIYTEKNDFLISINNFLSEKFKYKNHGLIKNNFYDNLSPERLHFQQLNLINHETFLKVNDVLEFKRDSYKEYNLNLSSELTKAHISILDVDETGFIDLRQSLLNQTVTQPLLCHPNDILISCLNPSNWRVTVVPNFENFVWSCSPEFAVFSLKKNSKFNIYSIFFMLISPYVKNQVQSFVKGTSSSRQRVDKKLLGSIILPPNTPLSDKDINNIIINRIKFYNDRLLELKLFKHINNQFKQTSKSADIIDRHN